MFMYHEFDAALALREQELKLARINREAWKQADFGKKQSLAYFMLQIIKCFA
jgi:hypothetical protein